MTNQYRQVGFSEDHQPLFRNIKTGELTVNPTTSPKTTPSTSGTSRTTQQAAQTDEQRLAELTRDREVITEVERTTTERGTQDITKIYDAQTRQLIATKTDTTLNVFVDSQGRRTSPTLEQVTGRETPTLKPIAKEITQKRADPIIDILNPRTSGQKKTESDALIISAVLDPQRHRSATMPIKTQGVRQKAPDSIFLNVKTTDKEKTELLLNKIYGKPKQIGGTIAPRYKSVENVVLTEQKTETFGFRTDELNVSLHGERYGYLERTASRLASSDATLGLKIEYFTYTVFKQTGQKVRSIFSTVATPEGFLTGAAVVGLASVAPPVALYAAGAFIVTSIAKDTQQAVSDIKFKRYALPSFKIEAASKPVSTATTAASFFFAYKGVKAVSTQPIIFKIDAKAYTSGFENWGLRQPTQLDLNILKSITSGGKFNMEVKTAGKNLFKDFLEVKLTSDDISIIDKDWFGVGFPDVAPAKTKFLFPENVKFEILGTVKDGQITPFTQGKTFFSTVLKPFRSKKGQLATPQTTGGEFGRLDDAFTKIKNIDWDSLKIKVFDDRNAGAALFVSNLGMQDDFKELEKELSRTGTLNIPEPREHIKVAPTEITREQARFTSINLNVSRTTPDVFSVSTSTAGTRADTSPAVGIDTMPTAATDSPTTSTTATATTPISPAMTAPSITTITKTPIVKFPIPIPLPSLSLGWGRGQSFTQPQFTKGFNIFVRRQGTFRQINLRPLDRREALSLGVRRVSTTAAATFKLRPAKEPAIKTGGFLGFDKIKLGQQFTKRKEKDKEIFIEKPKFRISSWGELQEITFKPRGLKNVKI